MAKTIFTYDISTGSHIVGDYSTTAEDAAADLTSATSAAPTMLALHQQGTGYNEDSAAVSESAAVATLHSSAATDGDGCSSVSCQNNGTCILLSIGIFDCV